MNNNTLNHTAVGAAPLLTSAQCTVLRGLAIIGIFLHNYCHWLGPIVKENEYTYTAANCRRLFEVLASPDWTLPVHLLSFFGHYGVPVFLFLSAYGLVMKYEKGNKPAPAIVPFVRYHYLKLFKMMMVGFVAFTIVDAMTPGQWRYTLVNIVAQLGMFNNVMPDPDHIIWPGPFWFFGLMLQLYIIYIVLLNRGGWKTLAALVLACWAMQAVCDPESETLNRIRYNFMGGIMPFALGLLAARYGARFATVGKAQWAAVLVLSGAAIFAFSFSYQLWFWVPFFVCTFSVALAKLMKSNATEQGMGHWLLWVGRVSAALFVIHPVTRKIFIPISRRGDIYTGLLLYILASLALAWLCSEVMKKIPNPKLKEKEHENT